MDYINVPRDIALCRDREQTFSFADPVGIVTPPVLPVECPSGASFEPTLGGFRVWASCRSYMALVLVPFTMLWAGFSTGGILGRQIARGEFRFWESLLGVPFLIGSIILASMCSMCVLGRVTVTVTGGGGEVFTGVGPLGWRRRFSWDDVRDANEVMGTHSSNHEPARGIRLDSPRPFSFGSMLNESRRLYLLSILRRELQGRGKVRPMSDRL